MIFLIFNQGHDLHVHFQGHDNTFKIIPKVKTLTSWLHFQCNIKGHDFLKVMKTLSRSYQTIGSPYDYVVT